MEDKKSVFAKFYKRLVKTGKINDNGLPEFEERIYVKIRVLNSFDEVDRMAEREDFMRFAQEWDYFQRSQEKSKQGTPLEMFAFLNPAQIECCNIKGVYTIEDLSKLTKENANSLGLATEAELAKKFLSVSKNNKAISEAQKRIEELEKEVAALRAENQELRSIKQEE